MSYFLLIYFSFEWFGLLLQMWFELMIVLQVCLVLVMWTLINVPWAALALWPQKFGLPFFFSLHIQMTGNYYLCSVTFTPAQLELRNTTTLFVQGIFSSVQYFGGLMFDLVVFCKDIPFQRILWQPICWANNPTNQKNSGENLKLLWWGDKVPTKLVWCLSSFEFKRREVFIHIDWSQMWYRKENP